MRTVLAAAASGLVMCSAAVAQSPKSMPTESVTVTAPGVVSDAVLHDFVKTYTTGSPASGKIARWRKGVCPVAVGLSSRDNKLVGERVGQIALMVGAPVGDAGSCKPNVDIVFTLNPQRLLDQVRAKSPMLLGYHEPAQEAGLAHVSHPVQAWYTTQTVDLHGIPNIDERLQFQGGMYIGDVYLPEGHVANVTGNHLGDGLSSELYHVIIVVDVAKVASARAVTDYIAMLALAQTKAFEACQPVASISNLVSACDPALKTDSITSNDLAYLHGLYRIDPRSAFAQQRDDIAYEMKKNLKAQ